jgi:aminoglycoside N3'-acetyltransferase
MPDQFAADDLAADLRRLGVADGDLVMVHASLRAVGAVHGDADVVLDGLLAAVGPDGTLLMTLGARDDTPFDHLITPADPDVGVLAEVFRTRPGTLVTDHPEGRFGASGRLASTLVDEVPWDDYYGPGSPLERLVQAGGRVLRLGADLDTVTLLHYAEYLAPISSKRRVRRHPVVAGADGPVRRTVECLDDSNGIVDYPGEDYFAVIVRHYLATGRAAVGTVGGATSELIDAADLVEFAVAWMAENLVTP